VNHFEAGTAGKKVVGVIGASLWTPTSGS